MAIVINGKMNIPNIVCLSSDVAGGKIAGANPGQVAFYTDTFAWMIVKDDLSLTAYNLPATTLGTGSATIGTVDTELPSASALDGTIGKGLSAPTVGAAIMTSDGTNLVQVSSTNPIAIKGKATPITVTFTRQAADTTPYTAKDSVGVYETITDATNASPIVCAQATHGKSDGDMVTIAGVTGNTNANGTRFVKATGQDSGHFALYAEKTLVTPIAGNGAFGGSPTLAKLFRLPNIFRENGGSGYITKIRMWTDLVTWVDQFKIHFYNSAPSAALLDNAVFTLLIGNMSARLGTATFPAFSTEGTGSTAAVSSIVAGQVLSDGTHTGLPLVVFNNDNSKDLYFMIEDLSAGTPAAAQLFGIEVTLDSN